MKKKTARLIIADSERCADLLYAAGLFVPDEFIWLEYRGRSTAVLSPLEIDRARRTARVHTVQDSAVLESAFFKKNHRKPQTVEVALELLRGKGIASVTVPGDFPLTYADFLRGKGIRINLADPFFPEREFKNRDEVRSITRGQRQAEAGLARGLEVLRSAKTGHKRELWWSGRRLTSEVLRGEIDAAVVRAGGLPAHTIVAGGKQACDPHEQGSGPLRAGESIILDIFPRDQSSGYFGDLTRTVVKGKPSDALNRLRDTVLVAQQKVLKALKPGADGAVLHRMVVDYFTAQGYPTEKRRGRWVGFFHGTGHSLGLEIHEAPRFAAGQFKPGHIMTVEPGLYVTEIGGVRIEDLVLITERGKRNLTQAPDVWVV